MNNCVTGWFADEAVSDHGFSPHETNRMRIASSSTAALFQPMAHLCARKWLESSAKEDDLYLYVWFLHVYMCLVSLFILGSHIPTLFSQLSVHYAMFSDFPQPSFDYLGKKLY